MEREEGRKIAGLAFSALWDMGIGYTNCIVQCVATGWVHSELALPQHQQSRGRIKRHRLLLSKSFKFKVMMTQQDKTIKELEYCLFQQELKKKCLQNNFLVQKRSLSGSGDGQLIRINVASNLCKVLIRQSLSDITQQL